MAFIYNTCISDKNAFFHKNKRATKEKGTSILNGLIYFLLAFPESLKLLLRQLLKHAKTIWPLRFKQDLNSKKLKFLL